MPQCGSMSRTAFVRLPCVAHFSLSPGRASWDAQLEFRATRSERRLRFVVSMRSCASTFENCCGVSLGYALLAPSAPSSSDREPEICAVSRELPMYHRGAGAGRVIRRPLPSTVRSSALARRLERHATDGRVPGVRGVSASRLAWMNGEQYAPVQTCRVFINFPMLGPRHSLGRFQANLTSSERSHLRPTCSCSTDGAWSAGWGVAHG